MPAKKKFFVPVVIISLAIFAYFFINDGPVPQKPPPNLNQTEYQNWIAQKTYEGIYTHKMIDINYQLPSSEELEKIKSQTDLARNYPQKINAIFEIGANLPTLLHLSDEIKDIGVNTYFVQAEYDLKLGKPEIFDPHFFPQSTAKAKTKIKHQFLLAKQKGFAVGFIPDYFDFFNFGKDKYDIDKFDPYFTAIALEWAKVAEEYGLEYFVPINEYEKLLESNGYDMDFVYQRTRAFYDQLMPQLRKVYSGKIINKTGHLGDWKNHANLSFVDADLFGVGTFYALDKENIRQDIQEMVKEIDQVSKRDNVPWLVTEFLVATPEDIERDFAGQGVKIDMKDAYEAGLSELKKARYLQGFTFTGWIGTGKIRETGAVPLLKEYFLSK